VLTIPENARQPLAQQIQVLRILVAAMALGVVAFAGYTIYHNLGKPIVLAGKFDSLNVLMLVFGATALATGLVIPPIIFRSAARTPSVGNPAALEPGVAPILTVQARIQTATIVGCALFEGGAFGNLVAYMQNAELLNLILAGVLLLAILARFPLPGACEQRILDELRRAKEQAALALPRV
jgi:hypothetical protein